MNTRRLRLTTIYFILLFAISGISFGFLVGRSYQQHAEDTSGQIQAVSAQVQNGGAIVTRVAKGIRHMLIQ